VAQVGVSGRVGQGTTPTTDVDWYRFTLDRAVEVQLTAFAPSGNAVISLYNEDSSGNDPYDPLGHRLLAKADATTPGGPTLDLPLGQGTYYVAVSGFGNRYFHPYIADSGYPGAPCDHRMLVSATDLGIPGTLPVVLPDVGSGPLQRSSFAIRLGLSEPLDPWVAADLNVSLTADSDPSTNLVGATVVESASELLVLLNGPLAAEGYHLTVSAAGLDTTPLLGQDYTTTFQVPATEGLPTDSPGSAQDLTLTDGNLVQVAGTLGNAPAGSPAFNGNDVNVYHFQITDSTPQAFTAEVFAGRIGSPLNPALTLYQVVGNKLHLVGLNDDSTNPTSATSPSPVVSPLQFDPVLYAGLSPGDYYLAVSASGNTPDPFAADVRFDPSASLGANFGGSGWSWGDYVLNVQVHADSDLPQVQSVTPLDAGPLDAPPTEFVVQFSEPVNLQQLVYQTAQDTLDAVSIVGPTGPPLHPRLVRYDPATNQATFLMLDRLASGTAYQLELSGVDPFGALTDLAGNPLAGPDGSPGTYSLAFTITGSGPSLDRTAGPNDAAHPQDLGVLAPFDLQDGVTLSGTFGSESADYAQLQVLQSREFVFGLDSLPVGGAIPLGSWLSVTDVTTNQPVPLLPQGTLPDPFGQVNDGGGIVALGFLNAGDTYVVSLTSWAAGSGYRLRLSNGSLNEAPPPLTVGPAPAIRLRFRTPSTLDPSPPTPSPPTPPADLPQVDVASTVPAGTGTAQLPGAADSSTKPDVTPPPSGAAEVGPFLVVALAPVPGKGTTAPIPTGDHAGPTIPAGPAGPVSIPASVVLGLGIRPLSAVPIAGRGDAVPAPDAFEQVHAEPLLLLRSELVTVASPSQVSSPVGADESDPAALRLDWLLGPGGLLGPSSGLAPAWFGPSPAVFGGGFADPAGAAEEDSDPDLAAAAASTRCARTLSAGTPLWEAGEFAWGDESAPETARPARAGLLAWMVFGALGAGLRDARAPRRQRAMARACGGGPHGTTGR
jgi:hypothetical protein